MARRPKFVLPVTQIFHDRGYKFKVGGQEIEVVAALDSPCIRVLDNDNTLSECLMIKTKADVIQAPSVVEADAGARCVFRVRR